MLKTGIYLLLTSSTGVYYRNAEYAFALTPGFKWLCLAGLGCAFLCFTVTYLRFEAPELLKSFTLRHMIKSPAWKTSSTI